MELKKAVFYNILIDRFSRGKELDKEGWGCEGPKFCGGTLKGVIERLEYLQKLGVDVLLLTPFVKGTEYHGYHTTDLFSMDPRLGTLPDLKNLLAEAHKRDMKVIMDWTINHVSKKHPYFIAAAADKKSEYRKWFHFYGDSGRYKTFLTVTDLPKLNLGHPPAKAHVLEATKFWLRQGVDGLRLDHVIGISHEFWKEFRAAIKNEFPDAILIGEAVKGRISWRELPTLNLRYKSLVYLLSLIRIQHNEIMVWQYAPYFDAMLDFRFRDIVIEEIAKPKRPRLRFAKLLLKLHYSLYPKEYPLIAVLDNADRNRLIFESGNDWGKWETGIGLQFAQDNPVSIYYGSEAGVTQDVSLDHSARDGDLDIRRPMPWDHIDAKTFAFYKKLIKEKRSRATETAVPSEHGAAEKAARV
ncbi:MAG: alpha-amylase family glycosyl hydrolase [bacterium]|nr:alpha-amylase family glycosyl hydrolase [bacterium]